MEKISRSDRVFQTGISDGVSDGRVTIVEATLHAELGKLITNLARMARLAEQVMTNAAIALHQTDPTLAGVVIAKCDQMTASLANTEQRCIILLARQAPVVESLRVGVAAVRAVDHLKRMANLARHIAIIPQLKHPNPVISSPVRPVLARMSLLASQLAGDAATAIEHRDPLSGDRLAKADEEVNTLHRHLFGILFAEDWSHGVEPAVDAALIGRYYERFADHAVAIAREVRYLVIDRISESDAPNLTSSDEALTHHDDLSSDSRQVAATFPSSTQPPSQRPD